MRFNTVPVGELGNAIQWFSDTYLRESEDRPHGTPPGSCNAIRTAPDRDSIRTKWWWTGDEMLAKLEGFTEVFYGYLGDW